MAYIDDAQELDVHRCYECGSQLYTPSEVDTGMCDDCYFDEVHDMEDGGFYGL